MRCPDIAVIINSYNRLELLKLALKSLSAWIPNSTFQARCITVVYDAGSTDGSVEWLRDDAPKLCVPLEVLMPMPGDDTSFAAGVNTGVAFAEEKYPTIKYLLLYETDNQIIDSFPIKQALAQLINRSQLAACGFTVRLIGGAATGVGTPFPSLLNFILGKNLVDTFQLEHLCYNWQDDVEGSSFSEVDVVYTSPLLIRLDAWKESGGLDTNMFPFSDCDVDWARRLRNLGWKMGVVRSDAVIHDNLEILSKWSRSRAIQSHRGRLRYFKRHHPKSVFLVWPVMLLIRHLLELISTQLFVKEPVRRSQLTKQFFDLLKASVRSYD